VKATREQLLEAIREQVGVWEMEKELEKGYPADDYGTYDESENDIEDHAWKDLFTWKRKVERKLRRLAKSK
jgi:hypothetical protein